MIVFGVGDLIATPKAGILPTNPTPTRFGVLQDVTVEFSASNKELMGKNQFPLAVARTAMKPTLKAKSATIFARTFNDFFFGGAVAVGEDIAIIDEVGVITTGAVTVAQAAHFTTDQGVINQADGTHFVQHATPGVGQYSVSAGVYTFNTGDNGKTVLISYTYTPAVAVGFKTTITNQPMGSQPQFAVVLANSQWKGTQSGPNLMLQLNALIASKLTLNFKNEDFTIPEFDAQIFDDGTGTIGYFHSDQ